MARNTASADSPPPPISPSPTMPLSVSTSTMVRTKRPQWQPLAWRRGASRGTVTVVARISEIFNSGCLFLAGDFLRAGSQLLRRQRDQVLFHVLAGFDHVLEMRGGEPRAPGI